MKVKAAAASYVTAAARMVTKAEGSMVLLFTSKQLMAMDMEVGRGGMG